MKLENAIKKLEKAGYVVSSTNSSVIFNAQKGIKIIEFLVSSGSVYGCTVRDQNDNHDMHRDYHAGVYCANITQAIKL